ncbi:hypothetical protein [Campylobacter sp.]|uniref:hypothetical protein n=1 Tax=Campylobacter sp. TaxID=205 RepID=UPI002A8063FC|nr:hypothetical protein [Campylobacter sp.]MDY4154869.1 hypothetical protein [Campylobacter sp.]
MKKLLFSSLLVAALASSRLNANEIEQESRVAPLIWGISALGTTTLSYLNSPTLSSENYSGMAWIGKPTKWINLFRLF